MEIEKMMELGTSAHAARQVAHLVHTTVTGSGMGPVPTIIIVSLIAVFALVGMVVGGAGRRPRGAHRA